MPVAPPSAGRGAEPPRPSWPGATAAGTQGSGAATIGGNRADGGLLASPRQGRLEQDARQIAAMFNASRTVSVEALGPAPAERYRVTYSVPGYWLDQASNTISVRRQHVVLITLPAGYPREKPYCTTPNPVWHPNFGAYICIADEWLPGQTLADVIVQIGDLLQYRAYNVRSPLNALAAQWAIDNARQLPVGTEELRGPEMAVRLVAGTHAGGTR